MQWMYNVVASLSVLVLKVVGLFLPKIKSFLSVRNAWESDLITWNAEIRDERPVLCFHCASLGEFEMIVPVLSNPRIRERFQCVVTFFSSSGYNHVNPQVQLDGKFYLPLDTADNMQRFVHLLQPDTFVFVKYDFWYNLITRLQDTHCKLFLVNGIFRPNQFILSFLGRPLLNTLKSFDTLFLQDQSSIDALTNKGFSNLIKSKDSRFDRVLQAKKNAKALPQVAKFCENAMVLIAGSSWREEEALLKNYLSENEEGGLKIIIAPHDVGSKHIEEIKLQFSRFGVDLYTDGNENTGNKVLVINTIGVLSSAYQHADVACIGGAFGKGLHNILEAAAWGLPIITGPNISRFPEAEEMRQLGALTPVATGGEFAEALNKWLHKPTRETLSTQILQWLESKQGASDQIIEELLKV